MSAKNKLFILFVIVVQFLSACGTGAPAAEPMAAPTTFPVVEQAATTAPEPTGLPSLEFVRSIVGDPNPLSRPVAVALDAQDNLYVLESGSSRIQVFDPDGHFLRMWGSPGTGQGQFNLIDPGKPSLNQYEAIDAYGDIAIDSSGNVYVLDSFNHRVQKFTGDGNFLGAWGTEALAGTASDGQFRFPAGIATDTNGDVLVGDGGLPGVQTFDASGNFLMKFGERGTNTDQFSGILGSLVVSNQGQIYISNFWDNHIQVFDSTGRFLNAWNLLGAWGIALDTEGNIYATQSTKDCLVKFDPQGTIVFQWGERGGGDGQFRQPMGLAIDSKGLIYVADYDNNRVQVFRQP